MFYFLRAVLALALLVMGARTWAAPPDVRVLIDVSGSMHASDPATLRAEALALLVELLPPNSRAGIWRFGSRVEEVVPFGQVDAPFKARLADGAAALAPEGSLTDIGAALSAAAAPPKEGEAHIILLTDGQLDIDADPDANGAARAQLLEERLPELAEAGFKIHTVALGPSADRELLIALALATGGRAMSADSAPALTQAFLAALDSAQPGQAAPLVDGAFAIDSSVEEFTIVVLAPATAAGGALTDPSGRVLTPDVTDDGLRWQQTPQYQLITVRRPLEGRWQLAGAAGASVRLLTDLRLAVQGLEPNANLEEPLPVAAALLDGGKRVTDAALLAATRVTLTRRDASGEAPGENWRMSLSADAEGLFQAVLEPLPAGQYEFTVRLEGPTFTREQSRPVAVRAPFEAVLEEIEGSDGQWRSTLVVRSLSARVQPTGTQAAVTVVDPAGRRQVKPMRLAATGEWQWPLQLNRGGLYLLAATVSGIAGDGRDFYYELPPIAYQFDPSLPLGAAPPAVAPSPAPPVQQLDPAPPVEPMVEPASAPAPWPLFAGGALLIAAAGGYWFWRRRAVAADDSTEAAAELQSPPPAPPPAPAPAPMPELEMPAMSMPEPELFDADPGLELPPLQPLELEDDPPAAVAAVDAEAEAASAAELDDAISSLIDELEGNR